MPTVTAAIICRTFPTRGFWTVLRGMHLETLGPFCGTWREGVIRVSRGEAALTQEQVLLLLTMTRASTMSSSLYNCAGGLSPTSQLWWVEREWLP